MQNIASRGLTFICYMPPTFLCACNIKKLGRPGDKATVCPCVDVPPEVVKKLMVRHIMHVHINVSDYDIESCMYLFMSKVQYCCGVGSSTEK